MEQEKFYTKQHLLKALKQAGLPCSYPTLIRYETLGKINKPEKTISFNDREWRLYTRVEIDDIIIKIRSFKIKYKN